MTRNLTLLSSLLLFGLTGRALAEVDDAGRTADLVKRFTYLNVTSSDANELFEAMKIHTGFNPRTKMQNPDPDWIPGWNALALTDEARTAVVQAAINRTWTAKVVDDYKQYRAAWATIEKRFRPELERIVATTGYYGRAHALATLFADVKAAAGDAKVMYPEGNPRATVGFLDAIVTAMVEVHRQAHCEFLLADYLAKSGINVAALAADGRAFADDAVERDLFIQSAVKLGDLAGAPPLPKLQEYGKAFAAVKWPTSSARVAETATISKQLVAANAAALEAATPAPINPLLGGGGHENPADPKLRWVAGANGTYSALVVSKVDKGDVELTAKFKNQVPYGCKLTGRLDAQGDREQHCQYRDASVSYVMAVKVGELPEGLELRKGDEVALWADLESTKETKTVVSYQLTARALVSVKRDGKPVW